MVTVEVVGGQAMNFDEAYARMREGAAIARPGWKVIRYWFYAREAVWAVHHDGRVQYISIINPGLADATDWIIVPVESFPAVPPEKQRPAMKKARAVGQTLALKQAEMKARWAARVNSSRRL